MTYTKDALRQIFQQPFNQEGWQNMLRHYFHASELKAAPERIDNTLDDEKGYYLGAIDTTDNYRIGLFYYQIQHGNVARKRVGLRNLVKSFINPNWGEFDAALVVFDSGSVWRLSFVCDIKGENTAAKRFTYVFGESDNYYNTPVGRFDALQRKGISFENIKEAFSVEALSKEFFDEYREHYADIVEYITGKRYVKEKGKWVEKTIHEPCHDIFDQFVAVYKDPEKTVRDYIKKLMGRLVFLQFLQKKEWMGVPSDRQDWHGGDTRFLQNKFNEFADKDNFIDGFLEPLFNDLNTNRQNNNDLASPQVGHGIKIPFLNGGLFQLDEEDCSNIRLPQHLLGDVLDFFERYNFTIDENDPNDAQIGVDPEMLGRVFENLLEDNKDKGAFYTPKEIVQYMCQESLIAYLQTGIDDEANKESIRQFVLTHEAERLRIGDGTSGMHLGSMAEDISIKLLNVKICDPAIGSGAFPMGLLRQLYLCQCAIHPELEEKNAADIKRHIIQNNIYGVDIEKGAVDIARLRFWLSLIVDEETPRFLPNLDFKIMQGNSLLEQYKGVDLSKMTTLSTEQGVGTQLTWFDKELDILRFDLREKLNEYYNCSDHQRKELLKKEIIDNVKQQLREQSINVDFGDLDLSANDQFTLWHTWFYDVFSQGGFDIVIGNPPYRQLQADRGKLSKLYEDKGYKSFFKTGDIYCLFFEIGNNILKQNGVLSFINPNTWLQSITFDSYRNYLTTVFSWERFLITEKIFDATVDTHCVVFRKRKGQINCLIFKQQKNNFAYLHTIDKQYISKTSDSINIEANPKVSSLARRILKENNPFSSFYTIYNGVKPFEKGKGIPPQTEETMREKPFVKEGSQPSKEWLPLMRGSLMNRYVNFWKNDYWILYGDWLAAPRQPEIFQAPEKIIVRQTGDTIIATIIEKNIICRDNLHICIPHTKISIKYVLGLLNSKLMNFIYSFINPERGEALAQVKKGHVEQLPILQTENEQPLIDMVSAVLEAKNNNVNSDTQSLEKDIDLTVYHLYGLTYDEVLIVDPETPITREEYEK